VSEQIEAAIRAVEAVEVEPFGDRRVRLHNRARQILRDIIYYRDAHRIPYDDDRSWTEQMLPIFNDMATEDELLAAKEAAGQALAHPDTGPCRRLLRGQQAQG
jgi:hypothetical protein